MYTLSRFQHVPVTQHYDQPGHISIRAWKYLGVLSSPRRSGSGSLNFPSGCRACDCLNLIWLSSPAISSFFTTISFIHYQILTLLILLSNCCRPFATVTCNLCHINKTREITIWREVWLADSGVKIVAKLFLVTDYRNYRVKFCLQKPTLWSPTSQSKEVRIQSRSCILLSVKSGFLLATCYVGGIWRVRTRLLLFTWHGGLFVINLTNSTCLAIKKISVFTPTNHFFRTFVSIIQTSIVQIKCGFRFRHVSLHLPTISATRSRDCRRQILARAFPGPNFWL